MGPIREGHPIEVEQEELSMLLSRGRPTGWPIFWGPLWIGALAAVAVALLMGLVGAALGVQQLGARPIARWSEFPMMAAVFSVLGAFFSFVIGGWVAVKLAGLTRSEPAMLQGAMVWLLALPILLVFVSMGAGAFGGWYAGLAGTPAWAATEASDPIALRNGALAAVTALLLGLVGGVLGGWFGCGEPMQLRGRPVHTERG